MSLSNNDFIGILSLGAGVIGNVLYLRSLLKKHTRPHGFTWLIWGLLTSIAFFAQRADGAGAGDWATGFTAVSCFFVAGWAIFHGEKSIARSDWFMLAAAFVTLLLWHVNKDPLASVILIVAIDLFGFWPTLRKSWQKPWEEALSPYALGMLKFLLALAAMQSYSAVTMLYPLSIVLSNVVFIAMTLRRRHVIRLPGNRET